MAPIDFMLAALLLMAPPENFPDSPDADIHACLGPALQSLSFHFEILDSRETRYVLSRPEDFSTDLRLLRKRYHELAEAPPLHDSLRFPDRTVIQEMLNFNRAYRHYLDAKKTMEPAFWEDLHAAVKETDQLHQVWDLIRDARCEYYYVTVRRHSLKKVLESIGPEAYYNGIYPPAVPIWRFASID